MTEDDERLDSAVDHPDEMWGKKEFSLLRHRLEHLPVASRARLQGRFMETLLGDTVSVDTPKGPIRFAVLGRTAGARAVNLLTKQPGTIDWIDRFQPGSVFWDVGANVGAYTLYAARRGDTRVVAIEPAAVNYFLLAANCEANQADEHVQALLVGLGRERAVARLEVSQFSAGHSFSFKSKAEQVRPGRQAALVMSMDELVEIYGLPCPNYIKVDTPGMTEAVLDGSARTLARAEVREVHVELRDSRTGRRLVSMLNNLGFAIDRRDAHGSADVTFVRST